LKLRELDFKDRSSDRDSRAKELDVLHKVVQSSVDAHKKEAEIDKLQADTVKTLREASVVISNALLESAGAKEGADGDEDEPAAEAAETKPAKKKKPDPLAKLAEMHGETLKGISDLVKAQSMEREMYTDPKTGRKRVRPVVQ
jgi:hypothetical protein